MHLISNVNVDTSKLSPESTPHLSPFDEFVRSKEVKKFKHRFCGNDTPDGFLERWLNTKLLSIGGITPRSALISGNDKLISLVKKRIEQNIA